MDGRKGRYFGIPAYKGDLTIKVSEHTIVLTRWYAGTPYRYDLNSLLMGQTIRDDHVISLHTTMCGTTLVVTARNPFNDRVVNYIRDPKADPYLFDHCDHTDILIAEVKTMAEAFDVTEMAGKCRVSGLMVLVSWDPELQDMLEHAFSLPLNWPRCQAMVAHEGVTITL